MVILSDYYCSLRRLTHQGTNLGKMVVVRASVGFSDDAQGALAGGEG